MVVDPQFPLYFAVGLSILSFGCLLALGTSIAIVAGKRHFRTAGWSAIAFVLVASLQLLAWGIVHGVHGLYAPAEDRLEVIMDGLAPGLNAFGLGMLCAATAAFFMMVAALREATQSAPR